MGDAPRELAGDGKAEAGRGIRISGGDVTFVMLEKESGTESNTRSMANRRAFLKVAWGKCYHENLCNLFHLTIYNIAVSEKG